jgi:hypothetical protein
METVLRRAMPDIDLRGREIYPPERLGGYRHALFGRIALRQFGNTGEQVTP